MRAATTLAGLAVVLAFLAASFLLLADTYSGQTCTASAAGGVPVCTSESSSLIEQNGSWVLALLAVPLLFSAAGFLATLQRFNLPWFAGWVVAVSYALLCVVAAASIGFFFVPSALLLLIATGLNGYQRAYRPHGLQDGPKGSSLQPEQRRTGRAP